MRSSPALYPAVEILHIFGFVVLVGSILALDLRLLGLGRAIPIQPMAQSLLPVSRLGFLLAISMGFLLFSADAAHVVPIGSRRAGTSSPLHRLSGSSIRHLILVVFQRPHH